MRNLHTWPLSVCTVASTSSYIWHLVWRCPKMSFRCLWTRQQMPYMMIMMILGTWYSALLNAKHYERYFTVVFLPGHSCTLCHSLLRGSHPLPDQLPGEHTGPPSHTRQYLFVSALLGSTPTYSLMVHRSMVVGHIPMDHMCSFMCTNHIDMTVHNPAFLWVR